MKRIYEKLAPNDWEVQQRAGNSGRAGDDDPGLQPKAHRCTPDVLTRGTPAQASFAVFPSPANSRESDHSLHAHPKQDN